MSVGQEGISSRRFGWRRLSIFFAILITFLDMALKFAAVKGYLRCGDLVDIMPVSFGLCFYMNDGIFIGTLRGIRGMYIYSILLSLFALYLLYANWTMRRKGNNAVHSSIYLPVLFGGVASNLLDKVLYGAVVDPLYLNIDIFPTLLLNLKFNLADVMVLVGIWGLY